MSFYVIVNSDRNLDFFPNNKPYRFWTHLTSQLSLKGKWKIALVDVKIDVDVMLEHKDVYIYSNICGESIIDGSLKPLLRRICLRASDTGYYKFEHLSYVDVIKSELTDFEFYIKDEFNDACTFITQPVSLKLHLKSYPYFC